MYVLQAYGQLVKTIFVCKYLLSKQMRKRINAQLNKGEQLHGLKVYLWRSSHGLEVTGLFVKSRRANNKLWRNA